MSRTFNLTVYLQGGTEDEVKDFNYMVIIKIPYDRKENMMAEISGALRKANIKW